VVVYSFIWGRHRIVSGAKHSALGVPLPTKGTAGG
jgi:hypothetical protein